MSKAQKDPAVLGPVKRQVRPGAKARPLVERLRSGVYGTNRIPLCEEAADEIERLRAALERIARWHGEFPATGKFWDDEKTRPASYGAEYGSNGERDFMRQLALDVLGPNV